MLGIFLLYFIGKAYYQLAELYDKSKWLFAILGIIIYYTGFFIGVILLTLLYELLLEQSIDEVNQYLFSVLCLPIGIICCYAMHQYLKKSWRNKIHEVNLNVLDDNFKDL